MGGPWQPMLACVSGKSRILVISVGRFRHGIVSARCLGIMGG